MRDAVAQREGHGVREPDVEQVHDVVDLPDVRLEGRRPQWCKEARWPEQGRDNGVVPVHDGCRVSEPLEGCLRVGTPLGCLRGCGRRRACPV